MGDFKQPIIDDFLPLRDVVFRTLRQAILTGEMKPGERLLEIHLANKLGVSRTPIREALRRLEQERLINDTGKGSVVLGITEEDLLDIMNIREHIEALAAYYATVNATDDDRKELRHIMDLQDFYYSKWDVEHLRQVDDAFHDTICFMSRRAVITDTLVPLHRKTRRYRRQAMQDKERASHTLAEHHEICDSICSGDAELARSLLSKHIENAKIYMLGRK